MVPPRELLSAKPAQPFMGAGEQGPLPELPFGDGIHFPCTVWGSLKTVAPNNFKHDSEMPTCDSFLPLWFSL